MTYTMYDSVTATNIPKNAKIAAGYVDGHYRNIDAIAESRPNAVIVSITVTPQGNPDADVYDCEKGDGTPVQAAQWAHKRVTGGRHCTIYCSLSVWPEVRAEIKRLMLTRSQAKLVHYWIADWTGKEHHIRGAVAVQYKSTAKWDVSSVRRAWPGVFTPLSRRHRIAARMILRAMSGRHVQVAPVNRRMLMNLTIQTHRVVRLNH